MIPTPRPIGLPEIFREAVRLLRSNFLLFAGIALFPGLASVASSLASIHPDPASDPSSLHSLLVFSSYSLSFLLWIAQLIFQAFGTAAICFAVPRLILGETVTLRSAYNAVNPRAIRLVWVFLMQALFSGWPFMLVTFLVLAIPFQAVFPGIGATLIVYGSLIVLGLVPFAAFFVRYALAQSACVIEDLRAHASIERSIRLGRGSRGTIGSALLVLALPYGLLIWLCDAGIERLIAASPPLTGSHVAAHAIRQLPGLVLNLAWTPLFYIVLTLLYLKLVERNDNVTLPDLLSGALAAKRPKPFYDEGPAPWGEEVEIPPEGEGSSLGIPWSMFGERDTALRPEWETVLRGIDQGGTAPDECLRRSTEATRDQAPGPPNSGEAILDSKGPAPTSPPMPGAPGLASETWETSTLNQPLHESQEPQQSKPGESR
jgi:hypothetical protein